MVELNPKIKKNELLKIKTVSFFRQEATNYHHVFLPTIIKEIPAGTFTESTA